MKNLKLVISISNSNLHKYKLKLGIITKYRRTSRYRPLPIIDREQISPFLGHMTAFRIC